MLLDSISPNLHSEKGWWEGVAQHQTVHRFSIPAILHIYLSTKILSPSYIQYVFHIYSHFTHLYITFPYTG